jgi:hypothetical protein
LCLHCGHFALAEPCAQFWSTHVDLYIYFGQGVVGWRGGDGGGSL